MKKLTLILVSVLFSHLAFAQDSLQFLSATTGAAAYVTAYQDNFLFTGTGSTFRVYDVAPTETPPYDVKFECRFTSIINEIELRGNAAYICSNHAGISKWDISNPLAPVLTWKWLPPSLDQACYDVAFKGDSLFVANRSRVTLLLDQGGSVSHLTDFAIQTDPTVRIMGGDAKGDLYAFTVSTMGLIPNDLLDGVHIYDAASLSQLSFFHEAFGDHEDVLFGQSTDLLHVLGGTEGSSNLFNQQGHFYSLNISDPSAPYSVFNDTLKVYPIFGFGQGQALNAEIRNDTVFMVSKAAEDSVISVFDPPNGNIYVYDATDDNAVHPVTVIDAGLWFFDIALQDNLIHIASEWFGIRTKDISNIYDDLLVGDTPTGGWNIMSDIYGDKMVLANEGYGLKLFDIANPHAPVLIHEHTNIDDGFCFGVQFSKDGKYIYGSYFVANDGLRVFDTTLTQVGALSDFAGYESMHLWQDKIIAHGSQPISGSQVYLVDLAADPASPSLQTSWNQDVYDLAVNEAGVAFMSTKDSLVMMDMTDNLSVLSTIYAAGAEEFQALALFENTLYVNVKNKGLVQYTYDPASHNLTEETSITFPEGDAKWLAADSIGLYVGFQEDGLHAYDRSTLTFVDKYAGAGDFNVPGLWGMQDLEVKNGLIMLVEYFEQTTLLTFENDKFTPINSITALNPEVVLYPNPTSNWVQISVSDGWMEGYELYSPSGQLLQAEELAPARFGTATTKVSCSGFSAGLYLIKVRTNSGIVSRILAIM